jgi:hypothetical protein
VNPPCDLPIDCSLLVVTGVRGGTLGTTVPAHSGPEPPSAPCSLARQVAYEKLVPRRWPLRCSSAEAADAMRRGRLDRAGDLPPDVWVRPSSALIFYSKAGRM